MFQDRRPAFNLRDPADHTCNHQIADQFREGDDGHEDDERCAEYSGHDGERIADDGHPTGQERPPSVFLIERAIAVVILILHGEIAAAAPACHEVSKPPIHAGAEGVADGGHDQGVCEAGATGGQSGGEGYFR